MAPSKSQRKRDMHALQALGEALVAMPEERLAKISLPDNLYNAVREAQRITQHEAKRRQLQYVGRLMRDVDAEPIRAAIEAVQGVSRAETAKLHRLERLRERLIEDEGVMTELVATYPHADVQHLRHLRRNAIKERNQNKPPRAYRELFRELRLLEEDRHPGDLPDMDFAFDEGEESGGDDR